MKVVKLYEEFIEPKIISNNGHIELIDNNGSKIGQITMSKQDDYCELVGINIFPKYQGKGHFKKLMNLSFDWCKSNDLSKIELSVYKDNKKVIDLYKKYDFHIIDEPTKLGDEFIKMIKYLD